MIGGTFLSQTISKSKLEQWKEAGVCFQYNDVITIPSATNKYYYFDPTSLGSDITLQVFPLSFKNVEDGPCYVNYYAGSNYSGGNTIPLLNRNGESSNTPDVLVNEDPTGSVLGTKTSANKISVGGGFFGIGSGGENLAGSAFIANKSLPLLIEIVNDSGSDVDAEVFFEFCEVTKDLQ